MGRSRWFFVFIPVGILLVLIGIITGASSRSSTYKQIAKGTIAHYLSADNTGYLQLGGSPDLYIVHETDFSPVINGTSTFQDGDTISLVADPKNTTSIDKTSTIGTHLVGSAANVVQIVAYDDTTGQPKATYTTSAYNQDQNGYTQNNWPLGGVLIVLGLLMAVGAFFLPRKKPQPGFGITPGVPPLAMGQQPMQPIAHPYNAPYPQYPGAPQFQGQPPNQGSPNLQGQGQPPYQQPAAPYPGSINNPYGQPQPQPQPQQAPYPPYPGQPRPSGLPGQLGQPPANPYSPPYPQYPQQPQTGYEPTQRANPPGPGGYEPTQRANPYE